MTSGLVEVIFCPWVDSARGDHTAFAGRCPALTRPRPGGNGRPIQGAYTDMQFLFAGLLMAAAVLAPAAGNAGEHSAGPTEAIRFASLRAKEVNVRAGPGVRYPVDWVYKRKNMPVEVIAQFGTWRKIRDVQGAQGWIHQSMLSGARFVGLGEAEP